MEKEKRKEEKANEESLNKLEECVAYFHEKNEFKRVFSLMRKKWKKYGRIAGRIVLDNPSPKERVALEGFFAEEFSDNPIRFSMVQFDAALSQTRFQGVELEALLYAYFDEKLVTNKQEKRKKQEDKKEFFQRILHWAIDTYGEESNSVIWLTAVVYDKKYGYHLIQREYEIDSDRIFCQMQQICHAIEFVAKNRGIRLAVLGAEITKNPHEYDKNTACGKILIQAFSYLSGGMPCKAAEEILTLYYTVGIKPDDISSFTVAYGIHLYTKDGEHPAYRGFIENGESYMLTLANLGRVERAKTREKKVYVVENQMVFSHLCDKLEGREYALICTSGQLKTASLMLLDMLIKEGCTIFYSGDFDPEGIEIAQKVLTRGGNLAKLWRMSRKDYEQCLSEEEINEARMHRLDKISLLCLQEIKLFMQEVKRAGYQERVIDGMLRDICGDENEKSK